MNRAILKAQLREEGTGNFVRSQGYVPAILYGKGSEPVKLQLETSSLEKFLVYHGQRGLIDLEIKNGQSVKNVAMIKEVQKDPVRGDILHVDFQKIAMDEKISTSVTVRLEGEDTLGQKNAILQHHLREIDVACLPAQLPDFFGIDVSELNVGDSILVGDLEVGEGIEVLTDPSSTIVSLTPKKTEEVEEEVEEVADEGAEQITEEEE